MYKHTKMYIFTAYFLLNDSRALLSMSRHCRTDTAEQKTIQLKRIFSTGVNTLTMYNNNVNKCFNGWYFEVSLITLL